LRLKIVKNVVDSYSKHLLNTGHFIFTNEDKLTLALNLKYDLTFNNFDYFLISKKKSLSFFFEFPNLYSCCAKSIFLEGILPVVDSLLDRNLMNFRPFRHSQDFFLNCKTLVSKLNNPFWFFVSQLNCKFESVNWILKNFPFQKTIVRRYLDFIEFENYAFRANDFSNSLFFVFFHFLLNGLVWY
jgi:hypothetical protein